MDRESLMTEVKKNYEIRHYEPALAIVRKLAKKGDVEALRYLGKMAYFGQGMKKDPVLAYQSFYRAAIELDVESVYMVGRCLEEGVGCPVNPEKAFEYYSAASVRGNIDAELKEAVCYEEGIGVPSNKQKALEIYVDLAKKVSHPYATYRIGMAYLNGQGVAKSAENAFSWLNKALALGSPDAMNQFRLIGTKSKRDVRTTDDILAIGKDLYQSDRPKDAIIFLQIAASEGAVEAFRILDEAYHEGRGVQKSLSTAFEYAQKGAQAKDPESMLRLGRKYEQGDGVPSSYTRAAEWYESAVALGNSEAQSELLGLRGY